MWRRHQRQARCLRRKLPSLRANFGHFMAPKVHDFGPTRELKLAYRKHSVSAGPALPIIKPGEHEQETT